MGYNCLYFLVLRPPVSLMSLRREMSFLKNSNNLWNSTLVLVED